MPSPRSPWASLTGVAVPLALFGLLVGGCSDATDEPGAGETGPDGSPTAPPTESPTADVSVPEEVEVTAQGTDLSFGDAATVVFEPDQNRDTVLELTVKKARKGTIDDFEGFILDDDYKKRANYFYVNVKVKNVGEGNVGGVPVPLWGVNQDNTLLPAVNFTTSFRPCASTPLPRKFKSGDRVNTCLVYLSPDKGKLESLSFRPDQAFDPIEWTGDIEPPKNDDKKKKRQNRRSGNRNG